MSAVDELVTWLRAQLDEDERAARGAAEAARAVEWFTGAEGSVFGVGENSDLHVRGAVFSLDDIGTHIARWDPARALAEVEAKRRILDEWDKRWHAEDPNYDIRRTDDNWGDALTFAVKLLAQPYAGREGWREEWAA